MTRKILPRAIALAFAFGLVIPGLTAAAKAPSDADYYRGIDAKIAALEASGASPSAVDAMLAHDFGWTRLGGDSATAANAAQASPNWVAPSASDVTFNVPTAFWNSQRLRYEARATWQWKMCDPYTHCWELYGNNSAGQDGFGLRFSKKVNRLTSSLIAYYDTGAGIAYDVPEAFNSAGVTYSEYDVGFNPYSWDHGSIYMSFTLPSGSCVHGSPVVMDTKMGHTWASTSVDAITVSLTGISVTFSAQSARWTGISNPTYWYPCG